jgi:hypothetical protein
MRPSPPSRRAHRQCRSRVSNFCASWPANVEQSNVQSSSSSSNRQVENNIMKRCRLR